MDKSLNNYFIPAGIGNSDASSFCVMLRKKAEFGTLFLFHLSNWLSQNTYCTTVQDSFGFSLISYCLPALHFKFLLEYTGYFSSLLQQLKFMLVPVLHCPFCIFFLQFLQFFFIFSYFRLHYLLLHTEECIFSKY